MEWSPPRAPCGNLNSRVARYEISAKSTIIVLSMLCARCLLGQAIRASKVCELMTRWRKLSKDSSSTEAAASMIIFRALVGGAGRSSGFSGIESANEVGMDLDRRVKNPDQGSFHFLAAFLPVLIAL